MFHIIKFMKKEIFYLFIIFNKNNVFILYFNMKLSIDIYLLLKILSQLTKKKQTTSLMNSKMLITSNELLIVSEDRT